MTEYKEMIEVLETIIKRTSFCMREGMTSRVILEKELDAISKAITLAKDYQAMKDKMSEENLIRILEEEQDVLWQIFSGIDDIAKAIRQEVIGGK